MAEADSGKNGQGDADAAVGEVPARLKPERASAEVEPANATTTAAAPAAPAGASSTTSASVTSETSTAGPSTPNAASDSSTPASQAPVFGTPYGRALAMLAEGKTREEIARSLTADGTDAESVKVVLNSLPGASMPAKLPELKFDQGVNALAPELLSVLDMGMEGKPATVALYWLTFGAALAVSITVVLAIGKFDDLESTTTQWAKFSFTVLPLVGYPIAGLAVLRALWLLFRKWL